MLRDYETVLKAAADPNRVRVLKMLEGGELCVCQIVAALSLSGSTVSKHLSLLRAAGLVEERKAGRWVYFRLSQAAFNEYAQPLLALLADWLNEDTAVKADRERVKRIRKLPVEELWCPNPGAALDRLSAAGATTHG